MILITGAAIVAEHNRTAFLRLAEEHVTHSRAEPGCVSYHCLEDTMAPGQFLFVEKWRDREALQEHFAKPYSIDFIARVRALAENQPEIVMHDVSGVRTTTPRGA